MFSVTICALMGGVRPALLAAVASGGVAMRFTIPPMGKIAGATVQDILHWGLLLANGLLVSSLAGCLHRLFRRERSHLRQLAIAREEFRDVAVSFESMFEQSAMGIAHLRPNGRFLQVNRMFSSFIGYTNEDLSMLSFRDITHPDDIDIGGQDVRRVLSGEIQSFSWERRFLRKDRRICWGKVTGSLVRKQDETPDYFVAVVEDVTERKMVEETRHLFSEGLRQSLQPLLLADPDTLVTYLNPAFTSLFGYQLEDLKGKAVAEIVPNEERKSGIYLVAQQVMAGTSWHGEVDRLAKDGTMIPVLASVGAVRNGDDELIGFVASYLDLRPLREKEASLRNLAQAVEQSPESIVITNLHAEIEYVNAAFLSCTGYRPEEVIGQNPRILHSGETPRQNYTELWEALTRGQSWRGEFHNRRKDGSEYIEFANISPIRQADGRITHYVAVKEDITEKKRLAQELDQYRNHLEHLVQLRTQELNEAKTAAEAANVAKSSFLAIMSHEIRTPLNAVLGFAQIGIRESRGRNCQDYFAHILDSGQGLLQVIDDILDISKLQASGVNLERILISPAAIIDRSLQLVSLRAQAKGLFLTVSETPGLPLGCLGDPGRLLQVLANLLTNAVKFTPAGGSVRLTAAHQPGELTFVVSDTGIGIAAADFERLFQPFEQADTATTRRFGGTGLGLAISRQLVDLMGGTLSVESALGRGSHFTVRLPLTGEVPALPLDELAVIAVSLPDAEIETLCQGFVRCDVVADLDLLPAALMSVQVPTLVVMDGALLETAAARVGTALGRGVKLVAVLDPGQPTRTAGWATDLMVVERPLRCRHLRQAWSTAPSAPWSAVPAAAPTARLAGLVVLAAEDNEINRLVLKDMLRGEGAEVILCEDGRQALERVCRNGGRGLDVLLTDIQMPEMDGYALARAVVEQVPGLPIIGLTAHAMAEVRESCLAAGMVEHISKPIDLERLVSAVLRHTSRRARTLVIDETALMARYGGRRDFLRRLVATAISSHGGTAMRLREAAVAKDLPGLRALAHTVKGSAGNLQAERLQALAAETEQAARDGTDDALSKADELAEALDDLMTALKQWETGDV